MSDRIPDAIVVQPNVFEDVRGLFFESFKQDRFAKSIGRDVRFVQDNHSRSRIGVLRGLHYQLDPFAQGKLVRVARGAVFDVAVDIRRSSSTFLDWIGVELSEDNFKQLWIPPGFAHGFLALTDPTDLLYKVTESHSPSHDRSIRWDDPDIGIKWPLDEKPILSEKDAEAPYLRDAEVFA